MKGYKVKFAYPVTVIVAGLCVVLFVLNIVTLGWLNDTLLSVYRASMFDPLTYVRFLTHSYGHATVSHIFNNLTLWLLVAPVVEDRIGGFRFLSYIFTTSFIIGLTQFLLFPNVALCGLSGVIFMCIVLSAYGSSNSSKEIPITVILVIVLWIGREAYDSLSIDDGVSQFSHLLGGLCGFLYGLRKH